MSQSPFESQRLTDMDVIQREALELAGIGLFRYALDGTIVFMDSNTLRVLGLEKIFPAPSLVIGRNISMLWAHSSSDEPLWDEMQGKACVRGREYRFRTPDGAERWALYDSYLVRDRSSHRDAVQVMLRDVTERKRTEAAIEESEQLFRRTFDQSPVGAAIVGLDYRFERVNEALCRITGYSRDELTALHLPEIVHPEDRDEDMEYLRRLAAGEIDEYQLEKCYIRKNGCIAWVQLSVRVLRDADGRPLHYLPTMADVTRRKEAQEVLHQSEARLRAIVADQTELISRTLPDGTITFVNDAYCRYFGEDREDLIGRSFWHHLPEGEIEKVKGYLAALTADNPVATIQHTALGPGGDGPRVLRWTDRAIFDEEGKLVEYQSVGRDVTDAARSAEALRERERYFRSLLDSISEDIQVVDRSYRITDVNMGLMSADSKRDELIGRHCFEVSHGLDRPCGLSGKECALQRVFETGKPFGSRHEHVHADGSKHAVDILFSPLRGPDGTTTHVIKAVRDASREMELEKQVRHAQKLEAVGTLAGGIAHDFNNILGIIQGYAEMSLFDLREDDPVRDNLNHVFKACRRASDLVRQILAFSRQHEEETLRPIKMTPVVKEAIKLLRSAIPATIEVRLTIDAGADDDTVLGDPAQLHQLLMNLCTNAHDALRDGGGVMEVRLCAIELGSNDRDLHPGLKPGAYVKLSVGDTGHGIPHEVVERIFEPYFTTKGPGHGGGLGLSVVHGIVANLGGVVTVESTPGKGTVFQVFLPRSVSRDDRLPDVFGFEGVPMGKERILLVDDEQELAHWGKTMLERLGYLVDARGSSVDALRAFRARPETYDLVITDQTMPEMAGMELSRELSSIRPEIPIILCTGFSESITSERIGDSGIRELVMKPFVAAQIAKTIRSVLDTGRG